MKNPNDDSHELNILLPESFCPYLCPLLSSSFCAPVALLGGGLISSIFTCHGLSLSMSPLVDGWYLSMSVCLVLVFVLSYCLLVCLSVYLLVIDYISFIIV